MYRVISERYVAFHSTDGLIIFQGHELLRKISISPTKISWKSCKLERNPSGEVERFLSPNNLIALRNATLLNHEDHSELFPVFSPTLLLRGSVTGEIILSGNILFARLHPFYCYSCVDSLFLRDPPLSIPTLDPPLRIQCRRQTFFRSTSGKKETCSL